MEPLTDSSSLVLPMKGLSKRFRMTTNLDVHKPEYSSRTFTSNKVITLPFL